MKLTSIFSLIAVAFLSGCASPGIPKIIGRSTAWYETTDPDNFFAKENRRGALYYIGIYDPALGYLRSPVPGAANNKLARDLMSWVSAPMSYEPAERRKFLEAVERFARRYNPHVSKELRNLGITSSPTSPNEKGIALSAASKQAGRLNELSLARITFF